MRQLLYKDQDFQLEYEYNKHNCCFAHCNVFNYNKKVKQKIKSVWQELSKTISSDYIYMMTNNKQTAKFVQLFGFYYAGSHNGHDVYIYEVK